MKKMRVMTFAWVLFAAAVVLAGCKKDNPVGVTAVTLNKTALTLVQGLTEQLTATVAPDNAENKAVRWSTSDPNVASVSAEGKVSALKAGTTKIIATSVDGGKTATCTVTVPEVVIPVTGVKLDKTAFDLPLFPDSEAQLTPTIEPKDATNQKVTWQSSDPETVYVSENGLVKPNKKGKATITVTTEDGAKTATCEITVIDPIPVSGVSLNKTAMPLEAGRKETLIATITPADASDKMVTWVSSNPAVASVSENGEVTGLTSGKATITVTTRDMQKTATCEVTVSVHVTGVTLSESLLIMSMYDKETLVATVAPENASDKSVTWTSSNPAVATVSATGKVIPVAIGKTVITATTNEGGKTATCDVEVGFAQMGQYFFSDKTWSYKLLPGKTPIGVIIMVNPDGTSGKIVSMDEPPANWNGFGNPEGKLSWSTEAVLTGAFDELNGPANMSAVKVVDPTFAKYPAFAWCAQKTEGGLDWYLPATKELNQLYAAMSGLKWILSGIAQEGEVVDWDYKHTMPNYQSYRQQRNVFNTKFTEIGETAINVQDMYLSSLEKQGSPDIRWINAFSMGAHLGEGPKMGTPHRDYVRAMARF